MQNMKRLALAGFALLISSVAVQAAEAEHVTEIAENVYSYAPGDGYISLFVVAAEGVAAIEPVNRVHSEGLIEAIRSVTEKPVTYLLHSHNHWDHSKGGQVFREAEAKIVAHKEAFDWMEANPHPDMALPDEGWEGERKDIGLGGTTIEMHYLGISHGLGMTMFRVMPQKVAYIADVVTPNRVLFSIVPDFNVNQWKRALSEIEAVDFDKAVFSHSNSGEPYGTKADVVATREFIEDLQAAIVAEFQKGTPFTEVPAAVKLPKYEGWAMYDQWLPLNVWRVMLDMHMGPFPWRPDIETGG